MNTNSFLFFLSVLSLSYASAVNEVVNANNLFAGSIYKVLSSENEDNLIVSPFSIEEVLSLAQAGAKNLTGEQIRFALHLTGNQNEIKEGFRSLTDSLRSTKQIHLHSANKIYVAQTLSINNDFKKTATEIFKSGIENVDFEKAAEAADTINKWVEAETHEKIKNLVNPESFSQATAAVLINAVHFKGDFSSPFDKYRTMTTSFHGAKGVKQIQSMFQIGQFRYFEIGGFKTLELGFKGGDASLVIVLPNAKTSLSTIENQLDEVFASLPFKFESVKVQLPKFKIESSFNLKPALETLGIQLAFEMFNADFSGIGGNAGELFIDEVIQKTYIDVNEGGVDAGAVTAVQMDNSRSAPQFNKEFIADRPFIFYLKIKDIIMFAGKVVDL